MWVGGIFQEIFQEIFLSFFSWFPMHMSLGFAYNLEVWHIFPKLLVMEIQTIVHFPALPLQVSLHQNNSFKRLINFVKIMIYDERHSNISIKKIRGYWGHKTQPTTKIMWEFNCSLLCSSLVCGFTCAIHFPSTLWVKAILDFFSTGSIWAPPHGHNWHHCYCSVKERVSMKARTHTVSFQLVNRPSFVQAQNNAGCTCLLQNLAFCDPKGKPPAELDKDGSIVTGLLC